MKTAIRYFSRTGNTEALALAMAEALKIEAKTVSASLAERVDILFLGSALYALNIDRQMKDFIAELSPDRVGMVVCFSTTAVLSSSFSVLSKQLSRRKIPVYSHDFHCYGSFGALHRGRPDTRDLNAAGSFARTVVRELSREED